MVTKTFCDHCGNVVYEPQVYTFGNTRALEAWKQQCEYLQQAFQYGGGPANGPIGRAGGAVQVQAQVQVQGFPPRPTVEVINVDLCKHCESIWMDRVKAICRRSDPEGETDV